VGPETVFLPEGNGGEALHRTLVGAELAGHLYRAGGGLAGRLAGRVGKPEKKRGGTWGLWRGGWRGGASQPYQGHCGWGGRWRGVVTAMTNLADCKGGPLAVSCHHYFWTLLQLGRWW